MMQSLECPHCGEIMMRDVDVDATEEQVDAIRRTMHDCEGANAIKRERMIDSQVDKLFSSDRLDEGFAEIDVNVIRDVKETARNVFHKRAKNVVIALTKEERVRIASSGIGTIKMQRILTKKAEANA